MTIAMQICACISCCASFLVIFLFLKTPQLLNSIFTKLIFYIAISDLFSSIGISLGFSYRGSIKCYAQGILTNIFPISGVFWTTIIAYQLATSIFQRRMVTKINYQLHLLCWGLPVLVTFLPLITNDIGPEDGDRGWCFLKNRSNSPSWSLLFWTIVSFYLWIWGAMIIFCLLFFAIVYETYRIFRVSGTNDHISSAQLSSTTPSFAAIRHSFYRFGWYPLNVILCWFIPTIYDIFDARNTHNNLTEHPIVNAVSNCAPGLLGFLNVAAFIATNSHIRVKVLSILGMSKEEGDQAAVDNEPAPPSSLHSRQYDPNRETEPYLRSSEFEVHSNPIRANQTSDFHTQSFSGYYASSRSTRGEGSIDGITMSSSIGEGTSETPADRKQNVDSGAWIDQDSDQSLTCLSEGVASFQQKDSDPPPPPHTHTDLP
jgi:hypothetical protein